MTDALTVLLIMCALLLGIALKKQDGRVKRSGRTAFHMLVNVLPVLLIAFLIAGLIQVLLPSEAIAAWLGDEAGWKGLFIAPLAGALIQGGPFTFFPLFSSVFQQSMGVGASVAMITGWGMINVGHLPYEFAFLGPRFAALKYGICIGIPPLAGAAAQLLFG